MYQFGTYSFQWPGPIGADCAINSGEAGNNLIPEMKSPATDISGDFKGGGNCNLCKYDKSELVWDANFNLSIKA